MIESGLLFHFAKKIWNVWSLNHRVDAMLRVLRKSEAVTETGGLSLLTSSRISPRRCKTLQLLPRQRHKGELGFLLPALFLRVIVNTADTSFCRANVAPLRENSPRSSGSRARWQRRRCRRRRAGWGTALCPGRRRRLGPGTERWSRWLAEEREKLGTPKRKRGPILLLKWQKKRIYEGGKPIQLKCDSGFKLTI